MMANGGQSGPYRQAARSPVATIDWQAMHTHASSYHAGFGDSPLTLATMVASACPLLSRAKIATLSH